MRARWLGLALVVVSGAAIAGWCRSVTPERAARSAAEVALARTVAAWVVEQRTWTRQADSLRGVTARLRADSVRLARTAAGLTVRVAAVRESLAGRLASPAGPPGDTIRRQVAVLDSGYAACVVTLANCEARAATWSTRAALAEAQLGRVRRRTAVVVGVAVAAVLAAIVAR
jgi:hypothetical protein